MFFSDLAPAGKVLRAGNRLSLTGENHFPAVNLQTLKPHYTQ
jgi:hypothetical protein